MVQHLRDLPEYKPPQDLHQQIMSALPGRRGVLGRLECALRSFSAGWIAGQVKDAFSLPSTPREMALVFLNMGVFFLIICLILFLRLDPGLISPGSGFLFYLYLVPSLAGAGVLLWLGWKVMRKPCSLKAAGGRLALPAVLFGFTFLAGMVSGGSRELVMVSAWLGLSGLAASGFLALAWRHYFKEVCA